MKKLTILKKEFWITFWKSFGCLGLLLIMFSFSDIFIERDINSLIMVIIVSGYYCLGFLVYYQEIKK